MTIRILIVDDQRMIRHALALLLAEEESIEVVGEADNGETALSQVTKLHPDVILMDILMPGMDGVEATKEICQHFEETQVLILSVDDDDEYVIQALRYGAAGYILKNTPPEELAFAIQAVHRGYTHLGPGIGKKIIAQIPNPIFSSSESWEKLTPREQEIVKLIATGASNREIANRLYITEKTVKNHITSILSRLNLRDRTQVAIFAHSHHHGSSNQI